VLQDIWANYKTRYIEPSSGRTYDPNTNDITTTEGESYTMLRAVWMDDKTTFDQSYTFTKDNLRRPNDHLFSWLYGELPDKTYGILTSQGGQNTAADADTDIALSLVFASNRWNEQQYLGDAKLMLTDIWNEDVVIADGKPYMGADNFEHDAKGTAVINPSYFAPYAYRIFSTIDPEHDWIALANDSYSLIQASATSTLDKASTVNLPPNWLVINKTTGAISASPASNLTTNYGFDAFRTPWRIALDWEWFKAPEAKQTLDMFSFLGKQWDSNSLLNPEYSHDGKVVTGGEAPAMYGGSIGYFMVSDTKDAKAVYDQKLLSLFDPDNSAWKKVLSYYDDNWAWFGIALYTNQLPDLAPDASSTLAKTVVYMPYASTSNSTTSVKK
jgi:endo-1,4-beta-D-glucanase Y